jgi:mRNA interferase RelE/StbE
MSSNENWKLRVRERIYKSLCKFPEKDRNRLIRVIEELPLNPYVGDVEKMEGEENVWRRRVGAYRIFYEIKSQERVIYVFCVERRTSKTY